MAVSTFGYTILLKLPKTAFLCSHKETASVVLEHYKRAIGK